MPLSWSGKIKGTDNLGIMPKSGMDQQLLLGCGGRLLAPGWTMACRTMARTVHKHTLPAPHGVLARLALAVHAQTQQGRGYHPQY